MNAKNGQPIAFDWTKAVSFGRWMQQGFVGFQHWQQREQPDQIPLLRTGSGQDQPHRKASTKSNSTIAAGTSDSRHPKAA